MQCAKIFSLTALPCMRGSAVGEKIFAHRNLQPNFFAQCRCQQHYFCLVQMIARKVCRTQLNAKKVAWCNYKQKMMPSTENKKGKSKGRTGKLSFANREGRPSTLRHSNLSFRSNISSVFEFQKRVELQLIFLEVLNRAVIFENISKLSFGPRQNMFRWKSYCAERYSFFHRWQSFSFSHRISSAVSLPSKYHSFEKWSYFHLFFCFLWKLFFVWANLLREATLRTLISWNLSFCVHSSLCEKLMQNFRWILFEGTRGKQRVQVFRNGPRKLSFSG